MDTEKQLVWQDIPGFEGRYQYCFETKQVKSLARIELHGSIPNNKYGYGMYRKVTEKILKPSGGKRGKGRYFLRKKDDLTRPYTTDMIEKLFDES